MLPSFLHTTAKENFTSKKYRWLMNWYPMFFGTGGKILFWSSNHMELHVRLRKNLWTYNLVGTIFGGSMFAAADPFYMVMLHTILGKKYVVWDKKASIRFRKPGNTSLYCLFKFTPGQIEDIKQQVAENGSTEITLPLLWRDKDGAAYAEIERVVYIADKAFYKAKKGATQAVKFKA
ncbi:MAG: DUF4442 domain-containing protein [Bacteroidetes bacterium]|nr:MAG: DUF4442 domain-containing protein [Bacteroidota bacterium]